MAGMLSDEDWEYIRRKKRIEYLFARPYLKPTAGPESEAELRDRIRTAILLMPRDEWRELQEQLEELYYDVYGDEPNPPCV